MFQMTYIAVSAGLIVAAAATDPVLLFVQAEFVSPHVDELQRYWPALDRKQPPGGYLLRFDFDVTGDGKPETFLATTWELDSTTPPNWSVYSNLGSEGVVSRIAELAIPPWGFFVSTTSGPPLVTIAFAGGQETEEFACFRFDGDALRRVDSFSAPDDGDARSGVDLQEHVLLIRAAKAAGRDVGEKFTPAIRKVTLAEYVTDPRSEWRPYDPKFAPHQQYLDPAEKDILEKLSGLTFDEARARLQRLR